MGSIESSCLEVAAPPPPSRCPRQAKKASGVRREMGDWISWRALWREPFRLFFPLALLAGLCGVLIWPLVLGGWIDASPILVHRRLMALGFLGGFVLGFVGTSMPRLLEAPALTARESIPLLGGHLAVCLLYLFDKIAWGDGLMVVNLIAFAGVLALRVRRRRSLPAPSFLMLIPAWLTLLTGLSGALLQARYSWGFEWDLPIRLLISHGFTLLCVLAAGGFLLPRFLGLGLRRKYSGEAGARAAWKQSAIVSLVVGFCLPMTYGFDVSGQSGVGSLLRSMLVVAYLAWEMPVERLRFSVRGVDWILVVGLFCLPIGILLAGWFPGYRVGLSHIEMALGFGLITLGVATRVVLGHTGNRELLIKFHPWVTLAAVLMILGVASRIVGELMPRLMISHYNYGALCWGLGGVIWGVCLLRHIFRPDPEG